MDKDQALQFLQQAQYALGNYSNAMNQLSYMAPAVNDKLHPTSLNCVQDAYNPLKTAAEMTHVAAVEIFRGHLRDDAEAARTMGAMDRHMRFLMERYAAIDRLFP